MKLNLAKLMEAVMNYKTAEQGFQSSNASSVMLYDKAAVKASKNQSKALQDLYLAHLEIEREAEKDEGK